MVFSHKSHEDTDFTDPDNASDSDDDEEFNLDLQEFQDHTPGETDEDFEEQDLSDEPNERESEIQMLFQELLVNGVLDRMLAKRNKMNIGPSSRNSDNLDDDEQDGDLGNGAQEKHQPRTIELRIDDVPGGSEAFYDAASPDTYFIHPWPRGNGARASCLDLLKRLHNYSKHIKERRTTLHQQVQKWLHEKYEPPVDIFPTEKIRRSKAKRFEYLAEESRFARENYLSTGALLQNTMLVDCMKYVYLNDGGHTGRRIQEIPAPTPKQLIVLIYVALLYKLTKFSQCPLYLEKETARDFGETSFYKTIFDQLVDDNTRSSRRVNWFQVQDMIRRETRQSSSDGGWSVLRALGEHWSDE
ncbi:hypothetical protein INT45_003528 [Circinella minor]|uniref:Uncharacterized protein n=1 Tax=Circinella minor TaxID=1195481 RepID=A0A8H7RQA5_9FUNG|nr:hypothetical protein INT45_003528 [Circinella minor]